MVSTPAPPTVQGISALLKEAGFPLSNYGLATFLRSEASPGFTAWKTHQPGGTYIAIHYVAARPGDERARLDACATAIRTAGYTAEIRERGKDSPWALIPVDVNEEAHGDT